MNLAHAFGAPLVQGVFKQGPTDFRVREVLGFELSGAGEHLCLHIRKTELTTQQVVRLLARIAGVRERDIGYAGLKDRMGVCEQWFSIYQAVPRELDLSSLPALGAEVLECVRNNRKIRRGSHQGNEFRILLRDITWIDEPEPGTSLLDYVEARLAHIAIRGVPNYFGEQRFGHDHHNIDLAKRMFREELRLKKGFQRGILLSAARSYVFNAVLSERVIRDTWDRYCPGDVMNLAGTGSVFTALQGDEVLLSRVAEKDIHPTGPLWGKGELRSGAETAEIERSVAETYAEICTGLEEAGLEQSRRSLRLLAADLQWTWLQEGNLELSFALPPGAYATVVLRELCVLIETKNEKNL